MLLPSLQSIRLTLASFDNLNVLKNLHAPAIKSLFLSAPTDPPVSAFWDAASKFIQASPQLVKLEMYDVVFLDDTLTKKGGKSEDRSYAFRDFLSALSNVRILKLSHFDITIILQSISAAAEWRIFPSLTHLEVRFTRIPWRLFIDFVMNQIVSGNEGIGTLKSINLQNVWGLRDDEIMVLKNLCFLYSDLDILITEHISEWEAKLLDLDGLISKFTT
ncbi:hypothetical protein M422DRAFT_51578 [Sphaerobolus stellatus SS14]|uniref:Uncharacterized protein n=1 Tax=Sphaerobolus stellatus (strain SS14) TaxID=990650 RepID=A0A0C9VCT5_SPHS4|nr:hypothetical protein M422DRAFT_51578 [Sphaerobolus stellatus SS14]